MGLQHTGIRLEKSDLEYLRGKSEWPFNTAAKHIRQAVVEYIKKLKGTETTKAENDDDVPGQLHFKPERRERKLRSVKNELAEHGRAIRRHKLKKLVSHIPARSKKNWRRKSSKKA